MNITDLKKANELVKLIEITETQLEKFVKIKEKIKVNEGKSYEDGLFNLSISQYYDGSGVKCDLNRYYGNVELVNVIISTLEKQIVYFKEEFAKI